MKSRKSRVRWRSLWAFMLLTISGCAALQEVQNALVNLKRLQFKLDGVVPGTLAGVDLAKVNDPLRFNVIDGLKLTQAFANKSLPLKFTLKVAAKNPNDGAGGSPQSTATLSALAWTLKIDSQETISGDINSPIVIPGTGEAATIPLQMSLDLYQFFHERGYKDVLNLALALAGQNGSTARLTLVATPTVTVAGVPLKYPGQINIVDKEFSNP